MYNQRCIGTKNASELVHLILFPHDVWTIWLLEILPFDFYSFLLSEFCLLAFAFMNFDFFLF